MFNLCSGASGFLLPLSGGADSSSTAAIVGAMAQMAVRAAERGDRQVLADARRCTYNHFQAPASAGQCQEGLPVLCFGTAGGCVTGSRACGLSQCCN